MRCRLLLFVLAMATFQAAAGKASFPYWQRGSGTAEVYRLQNAAGNCEVTVFREGGRLRMEGAASETSAGIEFIHLVFADLNPPENTPRFDESYHFYDKGGTYRKAESGPKLFLKDCVPYAFSLPDAVRGIFSATPYDVPPAGPIWKTVQDDSGQYREAYQFRQCRVLVRNDSSLEIRASRQGPVGVSYTEVNEEATTIGKAGLKVVVRRKLTAYFTGPFGNTPVPEGWQVREAFGPQCGVIAQALPEKVRTLFYGTYSVGAVPKAP